MLHLLIAYSILLPVYCVAALSVPFCSTRFILFASVLSF
jgi:hypothetical protein